MKPFVTILLLVLGMGSAYADGPAIPDFEACAEYYKTLNVAGKTIDVPTYTLPSEGERWKAGEPFAYWRFAKQRELQLGLGKIELDTKRFEMRLTKTDQTNGSRQFSYTFVVTYDESIPDYDHRWKAVLYLYEAAFDPKPAIEKIVDFKVQDLTSIFEMRAFFALYNNLRLPGLKTLDFLPGFNPGMLSDTSATYTLEMNTATYYKFLQYNDSLNTRRNFEEANLVYLFRDYLELRYKILSRLADYKLERL
jgi:hypothetical protein